MTPNGNTPATRGHDDAPRIEHLIELIKELTTVVLEENLWLAQGLPASRSKQIARKTELAGLFEKWVAEVAARKSNIQTRDEKLRKEFVGRMNLLKAAMDENIVRLRAAIEASRRRIDTVMSAIREQMAGSSPYTSSGRLRSQKTSRPVGTNIHA
jgi:hypothetical protein